MLKIIKNNLIYLVIVLIVGAYFFIRNGSSNNNLSTDNTTNTTLGSYQDVKDQFKFISTLNDPKFTDFDSESIKYPPIVGIELVGEKKVYPVEILLKYQIVNDWFGNIPVLVTYDPNSNIIQVYNRKYRNDVLEFEFAQKYTNGNMVLKDRQTGSLWTQINGKSIEGKYRTAALEELSYFYGPKSSWESLNSESLMMLKPDEYLDEELTKIVEDYQAYFEGATLVYTVDNISTIFSPKDEVRVIKIDSTRKAYKESDIRINNVVNDKIGGTNILLVSNSTNFYITAFNRNIKDKTLVFAYAGDNLVDQDKNIWNLQGEAIEGDLKGEKLEKIDVKTGYWFAWNKFYPEITSYTN